MKRIWQWLITALLVAIFLSLANWQWNRADQLKNPVEIDQTIIPIDSLITPTGSITDDSVGRIVSIEGKFVSSWIAPNQDKGRDWSVGLFQSRDNAMILVVRGFYKEAPITDQQIRLIGNLVPPQSKDVAETKSNQIGRVDSALFVTKTDLPLYAPFIQVISEEPSSGFEIVAFEMGNKVPGYYWQHISYVVVWTLFAITVIYLLFYQRRLEKNSDKVPL